MRHDGGVLAAATFPAWIMHEAREEWIANAYDDVNVSRLHADVAAVLSDLGVAHQLECLTDDEYFSLDLYLPDYDVALEVDGPSHFIEMTDGTIDDDRRAGRRIPSAALAEGSDEVPARRYRRTLSTELRDMFLRRRLGGLVTLPWFELRALERGGEANREQRRKTYVADKLRAAGVDVDGY